MPPKESEANTAKPVESVHCSESCTIDELKTMILRGDPARSLFLQIAAILRHGVNDKAHKDYTAPEPKTSGKKT